MATGTCSLNYLYTHFYPPHSGSIDLAFATPSAGTAQISQSINLRPGKYDFSFWYNTFGQSAPAGGFFTAGIGGQTFTFSTNAANAAYVQFDQRITLSGGTTTLAFTNGTAAVAYVAGIDDVSLIYLGPNTLTPLLPQGAPVNAINVGGGIDGFINNGGLLQGGFQTLGNLSGSQLASALLQLDGEAATGAERGAFSLMNQFLGLMLDPSVDGRFGSGANNFAPDREAFPPDITLAYARVLKAPPTKPEDNQWTAWGTGFGGSTHSNGNPLVGSSNVTANAYGFAAGADYHLNRDSFVGFALAGAGTNWGLGQFLGSGRGDAFQAGIYGKTAFGPAYIAAALAYADNWFSTNRVALGDQITAKFNGQSYGGRVEGGYRTIVPSSAGHFEFVPYAAIQAQSFHTPAYTESDLAGGGLGLTFNAMSATDTRSELGTRFADHTALNGMPLILRARLAWAHDWVSNPALNAVFQALPSSNFVVNGAPIPANSALASVAAELHITTRWVLLGKFDSEWARSSQTYAGAATLRYSW